MNDNKKIDDNNNLRLLIYKKYYKNITILYLLYDELNHLLFFLFDTHPEEAPSKTSITILYLLYDVLNHLYMFI